MSYYIKSSNFSEKIPPGKQKIDIVIRGKKTTVTASEFDVGNINYKVGDLVVLKRPSWNTKAKDFAIYRITKILPPPDDAIWTGREWRYPNDKEKYGKRSCKKIPNQRFNGCIEYEVAIDLDHHLLHTGRRRTADKQPDYTLAIEEHHLLAPVNVIGLGTMYKEFTDAFRAYMDLLSGHTDE